MPEQFFTQKDTWSGGSFEFLVFLGESQSEAIKFLKTLWSNSKLVGPYPRKDIEPNEQVISALADFQNDIHFSFGLATIPNQKQVACHHYFLSDENGCWVYFGIPMGALGEHYPVGAYPLDDGLPNNWINPMTYWLREILKDIYKTCQFDAAVIGWLTTIEVDELLSVAKTTVPEKRYHSFLKSTNNELLFFPPTEKRINIFRQDFETTISELSGEKATRFLGIGKISDLQLFYIEVNKQWHRFFIDCDALFWDPGNPDPEDDLLEGDEYINLFDAFEINGQHVIDEIIMSNGCLTISFTDCEKFYIRNIDDDVGFVSTGK